MAWARLSYIKSILPYDQVSNTGALIISAIDNILVGLEAMSQGEHSILLPNMRISCGQGHDFSVEFPVLNSEQLAEHERKWKVYANEVGRTVLSFCRTSRAETWSFGKRYCVMRVLGSGNFSEAYIAFDRDGSPVVALKVLHQTIVNK